MNTRFSKAVSANAALLLTLAIGAPAIADDTELLIVDPSATNATPPNIMFILDTSGSMGNNANTTEPYDSTRNYGSGSCRTDRFYWTTLDVEPSCAGVNNQYIDDNQFLCADAKLRMSGIGAYTGILVQHHSTGPGPKRWQNIIAGNATEPVECQNDSGVHGDGVGPELYATAASGSTLFTADPDQEISWGSGDASQTYTIYDGNYLNWKETAVRVDIPKMDIMKAVTRNLMNAIEDVNVGLMRFTGSDGGRVIHGISDLNVDRTAILAEINGLTPGGNTPLAETLYEAARYWRGMAPHYGNLQVDGMGVPTGDIDSNAFVGGVPGQYQQPTMPVCTRNFNVMITDGQPTSDTDAQGLAPTGLPTSGFTACDGTGDGRCLDDISHYLSVVDIDPLTTGDQNVVTHTIGFAVDLDILKQAAEESGGEYYLADDVETLTTALMRIVEIALDKGLSFSAPTVAVNTFNRTQNFNDIYISTFQPDSKVHWDGNLKKYSIANGVLMDYSATPIPAIDPLTGFFKDANSMTSTVSARSDWSATADGADVALGGAANVLPSPVNRNVYTNYGGNDNLTVVSNAVSTANTALTLADFGLTGAAGEPTLAQIIAWTRGADVLDDDDNSTTTQRNTMGDPLHSQPAAVVYGGDATNPDVVVYTATNDGYVHAVDGDTGVELWSFIPKQLLTDLPDLMLNSFSTYKHYGIDGDVVPVVADLNDNGIIDGTDFVHIIFGMRRGGSHYYSIDVTDKDNPSLNWVKTFAESGQSWSRPVVARVDMNLAALNSQKAVVIIGEGYDTVHDTAAFPANDDNVGAGISMLDLFSGDRVWRASSSNANLTIPSMVRSIPSEIRVVDFTGDGFVDRMYAVDVGGQVFRFDVFRGQVPNATVTGGVIARFGGEGVASAGTTNTRRFYTAPDVSIFVDEALNRRFLAVGVGSGYRAHPLDTSATDAYYSLRDPNVFAKLTQAQYNTYNIALDANMAEVTGQVNTSIGPNHRGWKLTVPAGQMILSSSATFDNSVFFISYEPDVTGATTCLARPGRNYLYQVDVANGDPIANNLDTMTNAEADPARITTLQQGGIAPTPAFLFPGADAGCSGHECSPPPIGCVGVECFDPGFENFPVRTLWTQDGIE
ncbi:MAG: PQQ-binding-like beta-propeller repeat protein [Gammaproteobacteria bacterium]|nr:PQQ-binding-like beta-propeller repeat protein [Gammaproteobacteria bacterium]